MALGGKPEKSPQRKSPTSFKAALAVSSEPVIINAQRDSFRDARGSGDEDHATQNAFSRSSNSEASPSNLFRPSSRT